MPKANEKKGFERIHYFLVEALAKLDKKHWPARIHCGGPLPGLTYDAQPLVAREIARLVTPLPDDEAEVARLVAIIETKGGRRDRAAFDAATKAQKSDAPGLKAARLAARSVYNYKHAAASAMNMMGKCLTNAITTLVQSVDDPRPILTAIDAAIVREELRDRLRERAIKPSSPVARVVSRPAAGKQLALVLAALEDDSYGLLVKLKNTWHWHEGDKATVFATVPDAYMAQVADDLG